MNTWRNDHITAIATDIDPRSEFFFAALHGPSRIAQEDVAPAAGRDAFRSCRQRAMLRFQLAQLLFAFVNVDDEDVGRCAGGDTNVAAGPASPPSFDRLRVSGGVFESVE